MGSAFSTLRFSKQAFDLGPNGSHVSLRVTLRIVSSHAPKDPTDASAVDDKPPPLSGAAWFGADLVVGGTAECLACGEDSAHVVNGWLGVGSSSPAAGQARDAMVSVHWPGSRSSRAGF
ncbi:hypothetical protein GCM10009787_28320 [Streptomyces bangladeshensis]|uniref:Uncharacterized protein n=1 Tax=Streptomyces bangladeshensis TaxID=295352 RepID=A0ABN3BGK3_9ACTN